MNDTVNTIRIYAKSTQKAYDGQELTAPGIFLLFHEESSLSARQESENIFLLSTGDLLTAITAGSQTEAGASANRVAQYTIMRGGTLDVTGLYTIKLFDGTLTVTAE